MTSDDQISSPSRWNFQPSPTSPYPSSQESTSNVNQKASNVNYESATANINLGIPNPNRTQLSTSPNMQANTSPNFHRSDSKVDRESLKLDLFPSNQLSTTMYIPHSSTTSPGNQVSSTNQMSPSRHSPSNVFPGNQGVPSNQSVPSNQFCLSVPSSGNEVTSVSVLSYSAPSTPMSCSSPLFPPLAVDVSTGGHRTSLSLEPLPHYGLSDDPARPLTKVTLSLRSPDDKEPLPRLNGSGSGKMSFVFFWVIFGY